MKRAVRDVVTLSVLTLLFVLAMGAVGESQTTASPADTMTIWQARRTIIVASRYAGIEQGSLDHYYPISLSSIRFTFASLEFDGTSKHGDTKHFSIALKDVERLSNSAECWSFFCRLKNESGKTFHLHLADKEPYEILFGWEQKSRKNKACESAQNVDDCLHAAERFAAALNSLHAFAISHPPETGEFHQQAAAWRALATKPPLPEDVRLKRMLAEDAIKNHNPVGALGYYELGLEQYPTWPEGSFNAALISGELGYYADAVEHMQAYLELVPDAPDAQSARDQIALWQYKAKENK